jgi:serine/threonine-protein kinase
MKRRSPLITLLVGAALGAGLLIASMNAASTPPSRYGATSSPTAAAAATTGATPSPTAAPTPTTVVNAPARADYAGPVQGGGASVAISIHGSQAIAYVCDGNRIEAWLKGTATAGQLTMTGKNGAKLTAAYGFTKATGRVAVHGTHYTFSAPLVHKPSGLYQSIAIVRGAKIRAGWIVLPDGRQVGSIETNADSPAQSAAQAPVLDVTTGTANDGGAVLVAVPISGVTGSGF